MIVCVCNGLNSSKIEEAVAGGMKDMETVLGFHGREPCCGSCEDQILECVNRRCACEENNALVVQLDRTVAS